MNAPQLRLVAAGGELDRTDCPQLGRLLIDRGLLSWEALSEALDSQELSSCKLGEVLIARGYFAPIDVCEALAEQWGLGTADLDRDPPDPDLMRPEDIEVCIANRILPWRSIGGLTAFAIADPDAAQIALSRLSVTSPIAFFLLAPRAQIDRRLGEVAGPILAARAAMRAPEHASIRSLAPARRFAAMALFGACFAAALQGDLALVGALCLLFLLNISTTGLRIAALFGSRKAAMRRIGKRGAIDLTSLRAPPVVTILVPLYRESCMIGTLLNGLNQIDYPRELLDVLILVEEEDHETRKAVLAADVPHWINMLIVPKGAPRTKPRALNYALDFCRGEIVGILDAEDHPATDQIREVVDTIRQSPPEVACVQCQLGYFNAKENWLSRCFQLEYAIWFDVLLRGFQWLRLPIPLGGTSVYFRRSALRALGGWDAHNVTEDADLGMRLSRSGMRCEISRSVTMEEANCRAIPWIRQRSRWLKGYLLTWCSHMRDPVRLWRDLGPGGFFGLNVLFLGAAATYLAAPLFWIALGCWLITGETYWSASVPGWAIWPAAVSLALGQATMLACACLAVKRRRVAGLLIWVPSLPVYWTLGAVAAWKAVIELIVAPYYWDKTRHGVTRVKAER
ncbi:MAG: glycosyltransferase family 2 protein [Pseudomonadota bacterium]